MNLSLGLVIYLLSIITTKGMKKYFENNQKIRIGKEGYKICDDWETIYPIPILDYLPFINILLNFIFLMEYNYDFYDLLNELEEKNYLKKMTSQEKKEFEEYPTIDTMNKLTDDYYKELDKSISLKFTDEIDESIVYIRIINGKTQILHVVGLMATLPKDKIKARVNQKMQDAHIMYMGYSKDGQEGEIVYQLGENFNGVFILYALGYLEKYSEQELQDIVLTSIRIQLEEYIGTSKSVLNDEDLEQFYNCSCQNVENQEKLQKNDFEDYFLYEFGNSKALIKIASEFKDIDIKEVSGPASKLSSTDLKAAIYTSLYKEGANIIILGDNKVVYKIDEKENLTILQVTGPIKKLPREEIEREVLKELIEYNIRAYQEQLALKQKLEEEKVKNNEVQEQFTEDETRKQ